MPKTSDALSAAYSLNADCTGTLTVRFPQAAVHWDIVVADNGRMFLGIITDPGSTFSMEAVKQ